ncbi:MULTISPECIES: Lon protease family protein [unclassified Hahella]|uniref:Lon protease family protein n=1 Tax=unclassified Hahella TaxID=2624107 RepID=UPI001C1EBC87|nr:MULTISPECIES: ATP-binding protein [unclassified Hahella]MBU6949908.1 AAA family ATPase [Hahella sp. HN01]MDG9668298.1 AAA family ATPase [Hahella sp. CR1]
MTKKKPLPIQSLYKPCLTKDFKFSSTRALEPLEGILGQNRAQEAVQFAISMADAGYNIYAIGRNGLGKRTMIMRFLEKKRSDAVASDWCYVNNFDDVRSPKVLRLPAGLGMPLKKDLEQLLVRLQKGIPQAFDNESYYERAEQIKNELSQKQEKSLSRIANAAKKQQISLTVTTPGGYRLVATDGEKPYSADTFAELPEARQQEFEDAINKLEKKLRTVLRRLSQWEQEYADKQQALNEEIALAVSQHLIDNLKKKYREHTEVVEHLEQIQADLLKNVEIFLDDGEEQAALAAATMDNKLPRRYQVNVMVHHDANGNAPIVVEDNPNYFNLFGAVENVTYKGTVFTDFTLIRPGALHRANGGYLLMDAVKVLEQPFVWDAIKRTLRSGNVVMNALEKEITLSGTISLEPEPMPLEVKIVLFGDRDTYLLLQQYDPDFGELFKVTADFESEISRTPETQMHYARFITSLVREKGLMPCDRYAVMRILEHSARVAEDQNRLSLHAADIANLLRESNYWANDAKAKMIHSEHVDKALRSAEYRSSRIRDQVFDSIRDGTTLISTVGEKVGQINALSVLSTGDHEFGVPSRVTATTHYGDGEVIDIERDVKLAGAIHSKGMMILSAYLASIFGKNGPIRISASIAFEQSYSEVDGDSASMAEFCAIISSIADAPIRQNIAITGSMNQFGDSQPVGGVNEKIEGFFETCCIKGLSGEQGVIIPASNEHNLMLNKRVLDACKEKKFFIYSVRNVGEALEILTGLRVGQPNEKGVYSRNTLFGMVQQKLKQLKIAERRH